MILTGKEIKEKTGNHLKLDDDKEYKFEQNGVNSTAISIQTDEEIKKEENSQRLSELRVIIQDKQLIGDDFSIEQAELKSLLNDTHDEYIQAKEQEAIDAYTLELIEGGIL